MLMGTALLAWLARKLEPVTFRLNRPMMAQLQERFDTALGSMASEVRSGNHALAQTLEGFQSRQAELTSRIGLLESSSSKLAEQVGRTRDELNVSHARDLGPLLRILAATEASIGEMHDLLRSSILTPEIRELSDRFEGPHWQGSKHAIYLGEDLAQGEVGPAGFLWSLRRGLDASHGMAENRRLVWIERQRSSAPSTAGILARDAMNRARLPEFSYNRMMRGATGSIEVLRAVDAVAVRVALEAKGRRDVRLIFRYLESAVQPPSPDVIAGDQEDPVSSLNSDLMERALTSADAWVFPDPNAVARMSRFLHSATEEGGSKPTFTHALPNHLTANPVALVQVYRTSLEEILARFQDPKSLREQVRHGDAS